MTRDLMRRHVHPGRTTRVEVERLLGPASAGGRDGLSYLVGNDDRRRAEFIINFDGQDKVRECHVLVD